MRLFALAAFAALLGAVGCATYRDQLSRGQRAFEQNEHERALALLRDLERDTGSLERPQQAQYCYLRGMTDYRIGYRADARHWLALAKAYDETSPGVLPADWKARMNEALDEMNTVVYDEGLAALAAKPMDEEAPAAPAKKPSKAKPQKP